MRLMKNILILGTGRSGTSMTAGLFSNAGYYMGDDLIPPRAANPKGFFEDRNINKINELLLTPYVKTPPTFIYKLPFRLNKFLYRKRLRYPHRWIASISDYHDYTPPEHIKNQIIHYANHQPFCYKDPRFSYTLPTWKPYLNNVIFVVVFRHPSLTADSIQREMRDLKSMNYLKINYLYLIDMWMNMYKSILHCFEKDSINPWVFIHFNQLFQKETYRELSKISGVNLNDKFPEKSIAKTVTTYAVDNEAEILYYKLCKLSGYEQ